MVARQLIDSALDELAEEAERMKRECSKPPCQHAWGITYAVERIKHRLDDIVRMGNIRVGSGEQSDPFQI